MIKKKRAKRIFQTKWFFLHFCFPKEKIDILWIFRKYSRQDKLMTNYIYFVVLLNISNFALFEYVWLKFLLKDMVNYIAVNISLMDNIVGALKKEDIENILIRFYFALNELENKVNKWRNYSVAFQN